MSLKSFDKFCENLILNEPASKKEILDERQNQIRSKITIEALVAFGTASILNTMLMDCGLRWSESYVAPMFLIMALCYVYWIVKNSVRGTLFGVNGTQYQKYTACVFLAEGLLFNVTNIIKADIDTFFIKDGLVSDDIMLTVSFAIILVTGILILVMARAFDKRKGDSEQ